MKTKLIRVDAKLHRSLQKEAFRQSMRKDCVVTIGMVIAQFAEKLHKQRERK